MLLGISLDKLSDRAVGFIIYAVVAIVVWFISHAYVQIVAPKEPTEEFDDDQNWVAVGIVGEVLSSALALLFVARTRFTKLFHLVVAVALFAAAIMWFNHKVELKGFLHVLPIVALGAVLGLVVYAKFVSASTPETH